MYDGRGRAAPPWPGARDCAATTDQERRSAAESHQHMVHLRREVEFEPIARSANGTGPLITADGTGDEVARGVRAGSRPEPSWKPQSRPNALRFSCGGLLRPPPSDSKKHNRRRPKR